MVIPLLIGIFIMGYNGCIYDSYYWFDDYPFIGKQREFRS